MMLTIITILLLIYIHQQSKRARYDRMMREREERRQMAMMDRMLQRFECANNRNDAITNTIQMKGLSLYIEEQETEQ